MTTTPATWECLSGNNAPSYDTQLFILLVAFAARINSNGTCVAMRMYDFKRIHLIFMQLRAQYIHIWTIPCFWLSRPIMVRLDIDIYYISILHTASLPVGACLQRFVEPQGCTYAPRDREPSVYSKTSKLLARYDNM